MRKTFGLCSVILNQAHGRASFAVQAVRNPQDRSHKSSQKPLSAQALSSNCARRRRRRASGLAARHALGVAAGDEGGGCMLILQRCQAGRVQAERRLNCAVWQGQQGRVCHLHSAACHMENWCHRHRCSVSMPGCLIHTLLLMSRSTPRDICMALLEHALLVTMYLALLIAQAQA